MSSRDSHTSRSPLWQPVHWLVLFATLALGSAGWAQAWKWQKQASQRKATIDSALSNTNAPSPAFTSLTPEQNRQQTAENEPAPPAENPTLALIGEDIDLMRQIDLLTEENERLTQEVRKLRKAAEEDAERAALDGRSGILQ